MDDPVLYPVSWERALTRQWERLKSKALQGCGMLEFGVNAPGILKADLPTNARAGMKFSSIPSSANSRLEVCRSGNTPPTLSFSTRLVTRLKELLSG